MVKMWHPSPETPKHIDSLNLYFSFELKQLFSRYLEDKELKIQIVVC